MTKIYAAFLVGITGFVLVALIEIANKNETDVADTQAAVRAELQK